MLLNTSHRDVNIKKKLKVYAQIVIVATPEKYKNVSNLEALAIRNLDEYKTLSFKGLSKAIDDKYYKDTI